MMPNARLPKALIFSLTHGQAAWVLWHAFSYQGSGPNQTFDAYLKYLRRNGVPFGAAELGRGAGHNVAYGYEHLMEVAFALALKAQGILKTDVVKLLAELRPELRPLYVDAWRERQTGRGKPVEVRVEGTPPFQASGLWLDLQSLVLHRGRVAHWWESRGCYLQVKRCSLSRRTIANAHCATLFKYPIWPPRLFVWSRMRQKFAGGAVEQKIFIY